MDRVELWRALLTRFGGPPAPRRIGRPAQSLASTLNDVLAFLLACADEGRCHVAKYSEPQLERNLVDAIIFDVDLPSLGPDILAQLRNELRDLPGKPLVFYSGHRGVHVWILLPSNYPAAIVDVFASLLPELLPTIHRYVDAGNLLNLRALIRAPLTRHEETNRYVVPLDLEASTTAWIETMATASRFPEDLELEIAPSRELAELLIERGAAVIYEHLTLLPARRRRRAGSPPPCVQRALEILRETGELDHAARFFLAAWARIAGLSEDEAVELFRPANDFDEEVTRYQVHHIYTRGYHVPKCRTIAQELGLCPYWPNEKEMRRCPYYPWIELAYRR